MCIHTRKICANCSGCVSDDCGTCVFSQDVTKFGGAGQKKKCCKEKMTGDETRLHVQIFRSRFVLKLLLYSVFILCNLAKLNPPVQQDVTNWKIFCGHS